MTVDPVYGGVYFLCLKSSTIFHVSDCFAPSPSYHLLSPSCLLSPSHVYPALSPLFLFPSLLFIFLPSLLLPYPSLTSFCYYFSSLLSQFIFSTSHFSIFYIKILDSTYINITNVTHIHRKNHILPYAPCSHDHTHF